MKNLIISFTTMAYIMHTVYISLLANFITAKPQDELVTSLPQMNFTTAENFTYGVYSGFVPVGNSSRTIHYLLVESQSN